MAEDIYYRSAAELAREIRQGERSPVDVVDAFFERIRKYDDEINAFVTVREEGARAEAEAAERAVERGDETKSLHGVPVAIKDLTDVADVRTTYGSRIFADHVPDESATVVSRLRDAGAIVLGKTNTPEFGRKTMTTNDLFGTTANPWDTERTVGGSSGGSAAALAAGFVPIAQGSDAAGSLRIPASACGVVGVMPDFGRIPFGPTRSDAFVNTHPYVFLGPMSRTVEDAALLLDVVAGPDAADPFSLPAPDRSYRSATDESIGNFDIGYSPDLGICRMSTSVREIVEESLDGFSEMGAAVESVETVFEDDWETLHDAIEVLLRERYVGMNDNFRKDFGIDVFDHREEVTDEVISRIEKGRALDHRSVRRAERVRTRAYDDVRAVFDRYDLLVAPTLAIPPFEKDTYPTEIDGVEIDPLHGWILTWPFNLTGNPVASVPAGTTADGLPVGLQIVAPRLEDRRVIAASAAFERGCPWRERYPPNWMS